MPIAAPQRRMFVYYDIQVIVIFNRYTVWIVGMGLYWERFLEITLTMTKFKLFWNA